MHNLPPPLHREWLTALLGDVERHLPYYNPPYMGVVDDLPWLECIVPRTARRSSRNTICPACRPDLEAATGKKERRRLQADVSVSIAYVPVPPAIRDASKRTDPVAYWIGRCLRCNQVIWAADDGKPAEAADAP